MKVLIACERSGVVRRAFESMGHDAWSCDLEKAEDGSCRHIQGDAIETAYGGGWDLMVAHPECRYLSVSGIHCNDRAVNPRGWEKTETAVAFFMLLARAPIERIVIENPVSIMSTRWRKPDQIVQPYDFGEDASKKTCFWLKGVGRLEIDPKDRYPGRVVEWPRGSGRWVERWSNQTDGGQNRLPPSPTRSMDRARTYPLVAQAMAHFWGSEQPFQLRPLDALSDLR